MKKFSVTVISVFSLLFIVLISFATADVFPTIVNTECGKIEGQLTANGTVAWKGIPFASPPVGKFRWKAPLGPDPWSGVREATECCDPCMQYAQPAPDADFVLIGSENCLYLNVWRPNSVDTDLPVYFWIHGGGNSTGSSSQATYDGAYMASQSNMVVVTTNYRLGPLGWLTHPALRKGQGKAISNSGNFGTLDIIKALKWVKGNIEAFGGDPRNITIAGESAGGTNVLSLIISPLAGKLKLFHKAISQSGPVVESGTLITISEVAAGEAHANQLIIKLLINDGAEIEEAQNILANMTKKEIMNYLAGKSGQDILSTYNPGIGGMISFPYCFKDGIVIHENGLGALNDPAEYNQVPMILGSNKEEHKLFMFGSYPYYEYNFYLSSYYPYFSYNSFYQLYSEEITDQWWKQICVDSIAPISAYPSQPDIFVYRFDYGAYHYDLIPVSGPPSYMDIVPSGYNAWPVSVPNFALLFGASHSLDIPFFWGNYFFYSLTGAIFREDNREGREALTDLMMTYVKNFAYTGDPNSPEIDVYWEPWSNNAGEPKRIIFDANATDTIIEMSTE